MLKLEGSFGHEGDFCENAAPSAPSVTKAFILKEIAHNCGVPFVVIKHRYDTRIKRGKSAIPLDGMGLLEDENFMRALNTSSSTHPKDPLLDTEALISSILNKINEQKPPISREFGQVMDNLEETMELLCEGNCKDAVMILLQTKKILKSLMV